MEAIEHVCEECGHKKTAYRCDKCHKEMGDLSETVIDISFAYGSCLDDIDYHFCSDDCFWEWVKNFPHYIERGG